ncbi:MAG TPA: hypothetical protein PKH46_07140 [Candidatus Cryosericum sp.]|nr:hypothetical protein [Candidatus Cryosericum sp.]
MESRRPWCFDCTLKPKIIDSLSYCPEPDVKDRPTHCPESRAPKATSRIMTWLLVGVLLVGSFTLGYRTGSPIVPVPSPDDVGVQLASQTTILCPSYLSYADQTRLEKGTGLEGVDFIYCERQTGIDALTLMAIAAHESAWGSNNWSKRYNNVMSWGISDSDPDRTTYASKTLNVLVAAAGLKRLYLTQGGTYWGGEATLVGINRYYASDKGWSAAVLAIVKELESKLTEQQRMKRWCVKTALFTSDVVFDYEHLVTGWALYKTNKAVVTAGR